MNNVIINLINNKEEDNITSKDTNLKNVKNNNIF